MTAEIAKKPAAANWMDVDVNGQKRGVWCAFVIALIAVIASLPFVNWFVIQNRSALFESFGLTEEAAAALKNGYSPWNVLGFVQDSKQGSIGLYGMIVTVLEVAATWFHLVLLYKVLVNRRRGRSNLELCQAGTTAMLFGALTGIAAIGYVFFCNSRFGMTGFGASPVLYLLVILELIGYITVKMVQLEERKRVHEHGLLTELRRNWVLFVMLIPTFIYFLINNYLPMVGVYFAFTSFNFRDGLWASPFIGWKNFDFLFRGDLFRLVKNTVLYNVVFILVGNVMQIIFAIFVSQVMVKWYKKTTQTLMFMPYFVSYVILKVLVYNLFEYDFGLVNGIITSLGGSRIDFYNNAGYWPFLITVFYIWKGIGYGMVVYLATITGIDRELYEAARVDGANIFKQIRYITLPLLKPTFIILLLYSLGSIMKGQFELFYQMIGNNGVLYRTTDILDTYVYRITMTQPLNIGIGTSAGLFQSVFGLILVVGTNIIIKRKNAEYALF